MLRLPDRQRFQESLLRGSCAQVQCVRRRRRQALRALEATVTRQSASAGSPALREECPQSRVWRGKARRSAPDSGGPEEGSVRPVRGGVDSDSNHDVCRGRYDMFEAFMIANLKASLKSTTAMFAQLCCDAMKCYDVACSKSHKF